MNLVLADSGLIVELLQELHILSILLHQHHSLLKVLNLLLQTVDLFILLTDLPVHLTHLNLVKLVLINEQRLVER